MKKYYLSLLTCCCFHLLASAQAKDLQTTSVTTAEGQAGGMIISYSIGEMVLVNSATSSNLFITNGILQPETDIAAAGNNIGFQLGEILVFPNPTPDQFNINFAMLAAGKISMNVYDVNGKQLSSEEMPYNGFITKQYNLGNNPAGTYLLQIYFTNTNSGEKKKGVYKIIRTN